MARVLVIYHSVTGNTEKLARAVYEGAGSVANVEAVCQRAEETTNADLAAADAIIIGSPTYFGQMSAEVKRVLDASNDIYGQLDGKIGAAFTTTGAAGCGTETTLLSILSAMLIAGMIVRGYSKGPTPNYGAFSIGAPDERALAAGRHMGARIAELAVQLFG